MLLKFVPQGPIRNISTLVQIMAWRRPGDKQIFELLIVSLLTPLIYSRFGGVLFFCILGTFVIAVYIHASQLLLPCPWTVMWLPKYQWSNHGGYGWKSPNFCKSRQVTTRAGVKNAPCTAFNPSMTDHWTLGLAWRHSNLTDVHRFRNCAPWNWKPKYSSRQTSSLSHLTHMLTYWVLVMQIYGIGL